MITIVSNFHNRPDFIPLQFESIRKFVLDQEITYIVANSAEDRKLRREISSVCRSLGIQCIPIKRDYLLGLTIRNRYGENVFRGFRHYKNGNVACSYTLMYLWKHFLGKIGSQMLCVMDSDMFFYNEFNPMEILSSKESAKAAIAFVPILRNSKVSKWDIYHPWNGLFLANESSIGPLRSLVWHPGKISGMKLDVGGQGHFWMKENLNRVDYCHFTAFSLHNLEDDGFQKKGKVTVNGSFLCEFNLISESPLDLEFSRAGADSPYLPLDFSYLEQIFGEGNGINRLQTGILKLLEANRNFPGPDPKYFDLIGFFSGDKFNGFVFHYKSVSNYQEWSSVQYNSEKSRALMQFLSSET